VRRSGSLSAKRCDWLQLEPRASACCVFLLLVGFGAGVYFATLWIAGFRLRDFKRSAAE
jgi:peptidoglycan biosynthesis protein MviN/MurJ (putative lipid II flippase)